MRVLVRDVMKAAAEQAGLTVRDLESEVRTRAFFKPRQRAMYVSRLVTDSTLQMIGNQFGGRDHTTVLNAWVKVSARIEADPGERALVDDLLTQFRPSIVETVALVRAETEALAA